MIAGTESSEEPMPRPIGPTIPRWQLGEQLSRLRERGGISPDQIANRLGCSTSKISKIEAGDVSMKKVELEAILDFYQVTDESLRAELFELQRLGTQRGWWARYGKLPAPFTDFLGLETAAVKIHVFEPLMVTGLLQTEEYARAVSESHNLLASDEERERQVRIRMERQVKVLAEDPPDINVILDEAALRRPIGGPQVMAQQLQHLAKLPRSITVRVVPFRTGGYPGILGPMTLFEFEEHLHSPVVYVESQAGNAYLEKDHDLRRCYTAYEHIAASALNKQDSARLIAAVAREYSETSGSKE